MSKAKWLGVAAGAAGVVAFLKSRQPSKRPFTNPQRRGTALITGASSGIGAEYARQLAAKGYNLIITARRREKLEALADDLMGRYPVQVGVETADLTQDADIDKLANVINNTENLTLLINNAGFGMKGKFPEATLQGQLDMIKVHIEATVRLTKTALPHFMNHNHGGIINVSSIAGFLANSGSNYGPTKAHLIYFSKGLQNDLAQTDVRVQVLCPGYTYTEFHDTPEYDDFERGNLPKNLWMSAGEVVGISLSELERGGDPVVVPGLVNKLIVGAAQFGLAGLIIRVNHALRGRN